MNRLPRLYPILDAATAERAGVEPVAAAEAILGAGATILQWRSKGDLTEAHLERVERIARLCRDHGAMFVVNDRADLALLVGGGLHVGQDDLPPSHARQLIGSGGFLGLSTHSDTQLRAAEGCGVMLDYLALGPIFKTRSKQDPDPVVSLFQLQQWRPLTSRPVVAIGGITRTNALAVLDSGADSVAVISDLFPEPCTPSAISHRVEEWLNVVAA
jgi:thiamine-phosphate pyrophosphorylase